MNPLSTFRFLRQETQRVFGEGTFAFFPTSRGGTDYTLVLPCTSSAVRGRNGDAAGLLKMATDSRTIEVDAASLPYDPRPDDIILFGSAVRNASYQWAADPAKPPAKFRIVSADKSTFHSHWRIEVERHV
jgi:hypothetical protein